MALSGLSGLEIFFLISAATGGGLFIVRFLMQLFGGDPDMDAEIEVGHADVNHVDADASFKLLTVQGLTAFFMMFGLVGFAMLRENRTGNGLALIAAVAAGLGTVWVIGKIFSSVKKLQSSGTVSNAEALGEQAVVYLTIHGESGGKVHLTLNGRLREVDAVAKNRDEIKTGERVKVVGVHGSTFVVEKVEACTK